MLLDHALTVKIADFGLAKYVHADDIYVVNKCKRLPIKWLSIEALRDRVFSTASDVLVSAERYYYHYYHYSH